jgi:hypothetical protein
VGDCDGDRQRGCGRRRHRQRVHCRHVLHGVQRL